VRRWPGWRDGSACSGCSGAAPHLQLGTPVRRPSSLLRGYREMPATLDPLRRPGQRLSRRTAQALTIGEQLVGRDQLVVLVEHLHVPPHLALLGRARVFDAQVSTARMLCPGATGLVKRSRSRPVLASTGPGAGSTNSPAGQRQHQVAVRHDAAEQRVGRGRHRVGVRVEAVAGEVGEVRDVLLVTSRCSLTTVSPMRSRLIGLRNGCSSVSTRAAPGV
jgi:hypothetical protein